MSEPRKTTKGKGRNFRTVKEGAGMTEKGVKEYRKKNPGSKLKTAVTKCDVKVGTKAYKRQKAFCSRSKSWDGKSCLLYTSPSPRDRTRSRMPSSA